MNNDYQELRWNSAPPLDASEEHHHHSSIRALPSDTDPIVVSTTTAAPHAKDEPTDSSPFPPLPLQAEKTALLVVDVQPEYWSQCPAVRQDFPDFPERLAATVDICRRQTCAKIIWVRADYRYSHSPWLKQFARLHGLEQQHQQAENDKEHPAAATETQKNMRAEVPCDPNSKDFTWEEFATPMGGEVIIPKGSWSSTSNTALLDVLKAANVDTVLVCGLITSVCVQHSAFGVFEAGYRTVLVTDACADRGRARHEAALALYNGYMYSAVTSQELGCESSPRYLPKAKPLWVLPSSFAANENNKETSTTNKPTGKVVYSPVFSPQLPPPSAGGGGGAGSTLSTSTSQTSLSSSISAMPPLQI